MTTDNQQVTINLKFPKPRILHNPQQVHLVTLRVQRLVQSKKNEVRLGSFKQLTRELTKDFAAQSVAAKVDFSLDYIVKNKRVYKGFSHLFKHSLQWDYSWWWRFLIIGTQISPQTNTTVKKGTQCYIAKLSPLKLLSILCREAENQTDYAPTPELTASFEDELFEDLDVDYESTILT